VGALALGDLAKSTLGPKRSCDVVTEMKGDIFDMANMRLSIPRTH
jgi:hypothetical protein